VATGSAKPGGGGRRRCSYEADGLYLVSLSVTTNLATVSATKVVSIQSLPEVGSSENGTCGEDCAWSASLDYDAFFRVLTPRARMEHIPDPGKHGPAAGAGSGAASARVPPGPLHGRLRVHCVDSVAPHLAREQSE
jgi:hypothetical protein